VILCFGDDEASGLLMVEMLLLNKPQLPNGSLRILNINLQSIRNKKNALLNLITSTDTDVIIGTETWLTDSTDTDVIIGTETWLNDSTDTDVIIGNETWLND
jgi:hypothetical protein